MIKITYLNGNVQNINVDGSFYSTVVEKRVNGRWKQVKLDPPEWRKHIMEHAESIAHDCSQSYNRGCPVLSIELFTPNPQENAIKHFNPSPVVNEYPKDAGYKKEQKIYRKMFKNTPFNEKMKFEQFKRAWKESLLTKN